jgi:tripartite-type tricarboxylate transporter receptor subunit TctC
LQALAQAAPDGYTIGVGAAGPMAVNPSLYEKLPYDPVKDFAPVTNMVMFPLLLVTHPSLPAKNVRELIALAKAKPGQVFYASPGSGNSGHLAGALFNSLAKVNITHVPYKGQGPAISDLLGGQVQLLYSSIPSVYAHVQQGRLNALAVGSAQRLHSMPNIPTIAESGVPGYEAYSWVGMIAPAHTPKEIVTRLNREIVDILKQKTSRKNSTSRARSRSATRPRNSAAISRPKSRNGARWSSRPTSSSTDARVFFFPNRGKTRHEYEQP